MTKFNMKIANRGGLNKNGCYPFSEANINNLPDIQEYIEDGVNNRIKSGCENVLNRSMKSTNKYRYGEMGLLISTLDDSVWEEFEGDYNKVSVSKDVRYSSIVHNRKSNDLIFIHNHPNGSILSSGDLLNLATTKSICAVIAVGNRHNVHIVTKESEQLACKIKNHLESKALELMTKDNFKYDARYYMDCIAQYIIENKAREFGLTYTKLRRKSV